MTVTASVAGSASGTAVTVRSSTPGSDIANQGHHWTPPNATPEEKPGSFRRHDIQPFPGGMVPPSWVEVPAAMVDWVDSLATIATSDNPVEAIAIAHAGFERTHSFLDGNGRTGRLLLNLLLVRLGYPPPSSTPATATDISAP